MNQMNPQTPQELYIDWRKCVDVLAVMDVYNVEEGAALRTKAMEIGYSYQRRTGMNIANHTIK
jgi:hypothetical protein